MSTEMVKSESNPRQQIGAAPQIFTSSYFDLIMTTGALASLTLSTSSPYVVGLRAFVLVSSADRLIKWFYTGSHKIDGISKGWQEELVSRGSSVLIEESIYAGVLLSDQKGVIMTTMRFANAFIFSLTASRSFRHDDPKKQDLKDAGIGALWAASREIILLTCSPYTYLAYAVISNAVVFGLNEKMKFQGNGTLAPYKFISSLFFRLVADTSVVCTGSMVPSVVQHSLFNLSRFFRDC